MARLDPDEWVISPAPHLGDTYFTCSLTRPFLERHGGNRVRIVIPQGLWGVLKLFPDAPILPMDPSDVSIPFRETLGFSLQEPFYLRPVKHWDHFQEKYKGTILPFTRMYHDLLELPFPSFDAPKISGEMRANAIQTMQKLDLPEGRTVILVPVSKSLTPFPSWVWEELAFFLSDRGYTVVTNAPANQMEIRVPLTRPLACPPEELIPIAELAGVVISARCGVCDLLSTAQMDLRIVYQRPAVEWKPMKDVTMEWDLGPCGLQDRATYIRLGVYETPGDFIQRIMEGL